MLKESILMHKELLTTTWYGTTIGSSGNEWEISKFRNHENIRLINERIIFNLLRIHNKNQKSS